MKYNDYNVTNIPYRYSLYIMSFDLEKDVGLWSCQDYPGGKSANCSIRPYSKYVYSKQINLNNLNNNNVFKNK